MDRRSFMTGALAAAPLAGLAGFASRAAYEQAYAVRGGSMINTIFVDRGRY